jgi:hypothetical protein
MQPVWSHLALNFIDACSLSDNFVDDFDGARDRSAMENSMSELWLDDERCT